MLLGFFGIKHQKFEEKKHIDSQETLVSFMKNR